MTQKREGESGDSPSLCHHSGAPERVRFFMPEKNKGDASKNCRSEAENADKGRNMAFIHIR